MFNPAFKNNIGVSPQSDRIAFININIQKIPRSRCLQDYKIRGRKVAYKKFKPAANKKTGRPSFP